jgi:hypothetical protein
MNAEPTNEMGDAAMVPLKNAALSASGITIREEALDILPGSGEVTFLPYPNPALDFVNLGYSLPSEGKVTFEIFNPNGQLMRVLPAKRTAAGEYSDRVDMKDLVSGVYVIRMTFENQTSSEHLIRRITKQ